MHIHKLLHQIFANFGNQGKSRVSHELVRSQSREVLIPQIAGFHALISYKMRNYFVGALTKRDDTD